MSPAEVPLISYVIAAVIVVLLLSFRLRRMKRSVPLRWKRLWIAPTVFSALAALTLTQSPLKGLEWVWLGLALLMGGALGWQRGRLMTIALDPANRTLTAQASPLAIYFLLGLIVLRFSLRAGLGLEAQGWKLSPVFINDVFVLFATGLFAAQALEMALRARGLLKAETERN
jgi:CcdC protein